MSFEYSLEDFRLDVIASARVLSGHDDAARIQLEHIRRILDAIPLDARRRHKTLVPATLRDHIARVANVPVDDVDEVLQEFSRVAAVMRERSRLRGAE